MQIPFHSNGLRYCYVNGAKVCTGVLMGRADAIPPDAHTVRKMRLLRVIGHEGDYDKGGAYWGSLGLNPLYCAFGESETEQAVCYVRAKDRTQAKQLVRKSFQSAIFYR